LAEYHILDARSKSGVSTVEKNMVKQGQSIGRFMPLSSRESLLAGSARSDFFASKVKNESGNWFMLDPKQQFETNFSKAVPLFT